MVKVSTGGKLIVTGAAAAVFALALTGCQGAANGVAATVNGTEISEDKVTEYITNLRNNYGYSSDEDWADYLLNMDSDPAQMRNDVVDMLVNQELIKQQAAKYGISPDSSAIDAHIAALKQSFENDAAWEKALKDVKLTEEKYRENIEHSMAQDRFNLYFEAIAEPEQEDIDSTASSYSTYYDGCKKVAHILFDFNDKETAKEVIKQLESGSITFEDAVKKYSKDTVTKDSQGVIGWTRIDTFPTAIMDELDTMNKGDISKEPVETVYGIHVIKVVDEFVIKKDAEGKKEDIKSVDALPDELQELIKARSKASEASTKYSDWLKQVGKEVDIVKNCMPDKSKYDIDLTPYREAKEAKEAEEAAKQEAADSSGDSSSLATGDGTSFTLDENGTVVTDSGDGSITVGDETTSSSASTSNSNTNASE